MKRNWSATLLVCAAALPFLAPLPSCTALRELGIGGDRADWVERRWKGVDRGAVLELLRTAVKDRYPTRDFDLNEGRFLSGWIYGAYSAVTHQGLRQRVIAETSSEGDVVTLRLRVQQETSESAGREGITDQDDWQATDDDTLEAKRLLTRLNVLLRDLAEPVDAPPEEGGGAAKS